MCQDRNRASGLDRHVLQELHELGGLIAVDFVACVNVRKGINRERNRLEPDGVSEQTLKEIGRANDALVIRNFEKAILTYIEQEVKSADDVAELGALSI